jgi:apolipoprotein N-acyltransferase
VRAANTGITGIVDPYGRVVVRTALFETTTVEGDVRLLDGLTVYGRIGDSFAWAMAAVSLLALFSSSATLARRRRGLAG